jgi:hypothetical protein
LKIDGRGLVLGAGSLELENNWKSRLRLCGSAAEPKNCGDETRAGQPHSTSRLGFTLADHPPQTMLVPTHNMAAMYLPYRAFGPLAASQVIKGGS